MRSELAGPGARVLVIGTGTRAPGSALPDLPSVERSVREVADALAEVAGAADVRVVLDPADPRVAGQAISAAAAEATDVLVVYFVGHGLVSADNELYLATAASRDAVAGLEVDSLPFDTVRRRFGRAPRRRSWSCSTAATRDGPGTPSRP
ncbi:hypothetical protein V5P93_004317 [Actinokineospora auranticolor]|uniref:Caspase domain-containing protein n=1 Tax=Actinokineospora auranticolor TaxID=155976 RepID=A0A2S6GTK4_9PSEU|nr:hypothetical protein [Actinokineospora auranticolor]PPK68575.1 hypothetical protein CLV40_105304 [Actinokineospora auranticolor]